MAEFELMKFSCFLDSWIYGAFNLKTYAGCTCMALPWHFMFMQLQN